MSGLAVSLLNDYYGSELAVFKLRCAPRSRFRVANTQQCGQRSLVRTGWLDGCLRVWVTKATCIRSLILLSTRAISLLLLLILSLNNAIIYSSHMFN